MKTYDFTRDEVTAILKEHLKNTQNEEVGEAIVMGTDHGAVTLLPLHGGEEIHNYSLSSVTEEELPELTLQEIPNAVTNDGTEKERLLNWAINNKELLKIQYQMPQLSNSVCLIIEPLYYENRIRRQPSLAAKVYAIINGRNVSYQDSQNNLKSFPLIRIEKVVALHAKD